MAPTIGVLMTVYNGEKYLKDCMEGVLNQTFENFEFLIVDDCSTDSSVDIITSYNDDRIRIIQNEKNIGQVKSLNIGLDYCAAEYVARIDQDDVMRENRLKRQSDFLDRRREVSVVGTWAEVIDEKGRVFERSRFPVRNEEIIGDVLACGYFLMHPSVMFRKKAVSDVGKYNESFSFTEDHDLWTRLLSRGYKLANIPEFLMKFRYHKENTSKQFYRAQLENTRASISNFIRIICPDYCDTDIDRLSHILMNAGLMKEKYWLNETNIIRQKESIGLLETLLKNATAYFNLKKKEIYLMKKTFFNKMLNFAYQGSGRRRVSLPLYLLCMKNFSFLYTKPKLYLYPVKSLL